MRSAPSKADIKRPGSNFFYERFVTDMRRIKARPETLQTRMPRMSDTNEFQVLKTLTAVFMHSTILYQIFSVLEKFTHYSMQGGRAQCTDYWQNREF